MLARLLAVFLCAVLAVGTSPGQNPKLPPLESLGSLSVAEVKKYIRTGVTDWNLAGLRAIDEEVLEAICKHDATDYNTVRLDGLKEISNRQLETLSPIYILSLNGLARLGEGQAKLLSRIFNESANIDLDGLTEISPEDLLCFAIGPFELGLRGLKSLNLKQAQCLGRSNRVTYFDGVTEIPDDVLTELLKGERVLSLKGLRQLSDRQAMIIAKGDAGLYLDGVRFLSDKQLAILVKSKSYIKFNGIERLSPNQERILREGPHKLGFEGLRQLSNAMAMHLIAGEEQNLRFLYPVAFSPEAAAALGKLRGFELNLPAQTQLSPEQARGLAKARGALNLSGLMKLSPEVAAELANHIGTLKLNGVKQIDRQAARELGRHIGQLELDGISELTDETAKELSRHRGGISFGKLRKLSVSQAQSLARIQPIHGHNAEFLKEAQALIPASQWPEFASRLGLSAGNTGQQCVLALPSIEWLDVEHARALGGMHMSIELAGLIELSDTEAELLTRSHGDFVFKRLPALTDRQAEIFSRCKGTIRFDNLIDLTEKQFKILANFRGKSLVIEGYFENLPDLSHLIPPEKNVHFRNKLEKRPSPNPG